MRINIIESFMGFFGFNDDCELIDKELFPKKPRDIAEKLSMIEDGRIVGELADLLERLKGRGFSLFIFERVETARAVNEKFGLEVYVKRPLKAGELFRSRISDYALDVGFADDSEEISRLMHDVTVELARIKVHRASENRDLLIVQAIQAVDDIDKTVNLFINRVREWYSLHFPELSRILEKHETYARLVKNLGEKRNFTVDNLVREGLPESKAEKIYRASERSIGAELFSDDIKQIQYMCENILSLYNTRASLERYLDNLMDEIAPNIKALAGSTLGARLIALAGGLNSLAKMPASTIQVLGAEKALFRSLRTGTRPPKHGVIFQHRYIREAKRWLRGKIARAIAGKLAIASRIDAFSGKYVGDSLKKDLEERIEEIKKTTHKPKKVKKTSKRGGRRRLK